MTGFRPEYAGDSIDGLYGKSMRYTKVWEELPPSMKRVSPTLYNRINYLDETMLYETGYVNTVNFGQGYKSWFCMIRVEDKNADLWTKLRLRGPLQMDMTLGMKVVRVMTLAGDIIKEISESGDPAIIMMNNYLGWDLRKEHFWK